MNKKSHDLFEFKFNFIVKTIDLQKRLIPKEMFETL